ncbi:ring-1,2-phenylacetyl-CoA epoxidase subunit PaaC [Streptoalloteichus tenebrarius]|uniref:Ring-1,2-phenylacetyl-CoA epoxidase subunit PaaC n=1 Tax=Streptoalloteichus tenebrarius (strain ATCC 17920 / DSM 40477 / JCM 4838 / CBS 697.72 / NBRC 16177 / NCIMB 11028 / NRRL B-12390 / A12253. 1 / ISP 5477) TaxID=1933 RepID=A0ABT1HY28_STRSD|nr:1,2-phenylacetyl-CoA epoxidase subunit PaaC [Streptoalloteichus tenebrarius]MCP2260416.1 ring-1,2-phenylacetyl-CoA epoxidase subunit PaaC [Streptoalloteichus tenebrarius]BFF02476.1 phenylacetate-CoA oxygenase subunit PaaC [Streptoalloteichus tenebrarius]
MSWDNAYESLTEGHDDSGHWAFGTGFADALAGVGRDIPSNVDRADLAAYCVMLGDDALVFAQRLSEWCSNAPELEEDVALANIALDLLGQARMSLTRAGEVDPAVRPAAAPVHVPDEDALAYFRDERAFRNVRMVEQERGDFAETIARLLLFSCWRLALFERLTTSGDPVLAAIAAKGLKELAYHRDHAARWTVRLGDGTEFSRERMRAGLDRVWPFLAELFTAHPVEARLAEAGVAVDPGSLRPVVDDVLDQVLAAAGLDRPEVAPLPAVAGLAGRHGVHTEPMGYLLAEMQHVARSHPQAVW